MQFKIYKKILGIKFKIFETNSENIFNKKLEKLSYHGLIPENIMTTVEWSKEEFEIINFLNEKGLDNLSKK